MKLWASIRSFASTSFHRSSSGRRAGVLFPRSAGDACGSADNASIRVAQSIRERQIRYAHLP
jgi:hypothetical protein